MSAKSRPLSVVALLLTAGLVAAPPRASSAGAFPFLLELPGEQVAVRYAPGSLERAAGLQASLSLLARDLAAWTGTDSKLWLYLVERQGWQDAGLEVPFGVPASMAGGGLALPAWGDAETVLLWQDLLAGDLPRVETPGWRGTPEEAASLEAADLAALPLAARDLMRAAGVWGDAAWVEEVAANLAALCSLRRQQRDRAARLERLFGRLRAAAARGETVKPVDTPGLLAAQAGYHEVARRIADRRGNGAAKSWLKAARKQGGRLEAGALLKQEPELGSWLADALGTPPE